MFRSKIRFFKELESICFLFMFFLFKVNIKNNGYVSNVVLGIFICVLILGGIVYKCILFFGYFFLLVVDIWDIGIGCLKRYSGKYLGLELKIFGFKF